MKLLKLVIPLIYIMSLCGTIYGYSTSSQIAISRTLSDSICLPGQEITITLSLKFDSLRSNARGIYLTDNIPNVLVSSFKTLSVELGSVDITSSVMVEHDSLESVYDETTIYRWILETPPWFVEDIQVQAFENVIVKYSVIIPSDAVKGAVYSFPNASWISVIDPFNVPSYDFGFEDFPNPVLTVNITNNPPNVFALISPVTGNVETTQTPYFSWEANGDPDFEDTISYILSVSTDSLLNAVKEYVLDSNSISLPDLLDDNSFHYWNVSAKDLSGAVTVSTINTFIINIQPEPPYNLNLLSPPNNVTELENATEFIWTEAKDNDPSEIVTYNIYFSKDSTFSSIAFVKDTKLDTTYVLEEQLEEGIKYYWYVEAMDRDSLAINSSIRSFVIGSPVAIDNSEQLPSKFVLHQNFPNPFNPTSVIKFAIPVDSDVRIEVFNMLGQKTDVLINSKKSAGYYEVIWDASNLPSGVYFISIVATAVDSKSNFREVKKALLLK